MQVRKLKALRPFLLAAQTFKGALFAALVCKHGPTDRDHGVIHIPEIGRTKGEAMFHRRNTSACVQFCSQSRTEVAMQKRNRFKQVQSLEERLAEEAKRLREEAELLPHGNQRDEVETKARQAETGSRISDWLQSPGLRSPQ
jgi:hypothetical protein